MYYFYNRDKGVSFQEKKRRDEEEMRRAAHAVDNDVRQVGEAGKARAEDSLREGRENYDALKVGPLSTPVWCPLTYCM
jgi:hypothetical protein